ncbi:MAG: site-2 protease family protein [Deltaproteobacteria bacterium]|nr:site-2 protease family protein [Deltaproteobacteria bacterium]
MKWSLKIGRFSGIDIRMHLTFILLIGWVALLHWRQGQSIAAVVAGVTFILAVFLCVILHEFGHALAARRYGIKTRDIILLPIGGVARLEKLPTNPLHELWVALAGPAVNIVIAAILFVWLKLSASFEPFQMMTVTAGPFFERMLAVNLFIIAFNMIPAFPMDGGRVLRAVLALRTEHSRATQIAASFGQAIAVFFAVIGLFYNPFLLIIAFFVWIGASREARVAQMRSAVGGIPVQQAMLTDFRTLDKNDSLDRAIELTLAGSQKDFPVVDNGRIEGILTQADLMKALAARDQHPTVSSAMQPVFIAVESLEMLETAFDKFKDCNCRTLPVTLNRKLVGLLTMDNLGEYLRVRAALTG